MKGILTKEQEKKFAKLLDQAVDLGKVADKVENKIAKIALNFSEMFDGYLFEVGITYLDDTLADKIPEDLKTTAGLFVVSCIEKDYEGIELHGHILLNKIVDIPGLTEDTEAIFFAGTLKGIIEAIRTYLLEGKDLEID